MSYLRTIHSVEKVRQAKKNLVIFIEIVKSIVTDFATGLLIKFLFAWH